ncbi:hypothetical protein M413DRAFT_343054 [Hebeloma cylindrosporum]|uniref:Uncharacterized protein n=1 Tax=Hebeloma cylindrosporum TaxID=76867 RepID=A0A0C3CN33_HEBCY|nr:hypothetical protein M413DRAFT_343054 [Hebeloma cylindrosporum h7]
MCNLCQGVEAEGQAITCVALEGGLCSPCQERASILRQIKQLTVKYHTLGSAINTSHDPFTHKLPPEIASHILCLCLPLLDNGKDYRKAVHGLWSIQREWAAPLKLGSVCRKWRQLAWATPGLWTTLYIRIKPSMPPSTAELLLDLIREWLGRSGVLPLTVYFFHREISISADPEDFDCILIDTLNTHSGRWRNLYLKATAEIVSRFKFSGSTEPKQLVGLELTNTIAPWGIPESMMESELNLTHLKLEGFPLTSISIRWDNITHATLSNVSNDESLDFLRRSACLEYLCACAYGPFKITQKPILHPRLRSLDLDTGYLEDVLDATTLLSLEEWTASKDQCLPVEELFSFLKRSGCALKVLDIDIGPQCIPDLITMLQALPSLERLYLRQYELMFTIIEDTLSIIEDILSHIFHSVSGSGSPLESSLLPNLRYIGCWTDLSTPPIFPWTRIPQLYLQGNRRPLTLKCAASKSDISDETALQLSQPVNEGLDLQIPEYNHDDTEIGDLLVNFRNTVLLRP